jgi:phosphatidate cytidylyltransferase
MSDYLQSLVNSAPMPFWYLMGGILALLIVASVIGTVLHRRRPSASIDNLNARIHAWWWMVGVLFVCFLAGKYATLTLCALLSFFALREFLTLTPTRPGDHFSLCLCFYIALPLQYILIGMEWYGMFIMTIPVYGFLLLPSLNALAGDTENFLERNTKVQWGLMLTVFCLSHAPALMMLKIQATKGRT